MSDNRESMKERIRSYLADRHERIQGIDFLNYGPEVSDQAQHQQEERCSRYPEAAGWHIDTLTEFRKMLGSFFNNYLFPEELAKTVARNSEDLDLLQEEWGLANQLQLTGMAWLTRGVSEETFRDVVRQAAATIADHLGFRFVRVELSMDEKEAKALCAERGLFLLAEINERLHTTNDVFLTNKQLLDLNKDQPYLLYTEPFWKRPFCSDACRAGILLITGFGMGENNLCQQTSGFLKKGIIRSNRSLVLGSRYIGESIRPENKNLDRTAQQSAWATAVVPDE